MNAIDRCARRVAGFLLVAAGLVACGTMAPGGLPLGTPIATARQSLFGPSGEYALRLLPPGDYVVTFESNGFASVSRKTTVPLGLTVVRSVTMLPAALETVDVASETASPIATPVVGANFGVEALTFLPDSYLTSKSFHDERLGKTYAPTDYANQ